MYELLNTPVQAYVYHIVMAVSIILLFIVRHAIAKEKADRLAAGLKEIEQTIEQFTDLNQARANALPYATQHPERNYDDRPSSRNQRTLKQCETCYYPFLATCQTECRICASGQRPKYSGIFHNWAKTF